MSNAIVTAEFNATDARRELLAIHAKAEAAGTDADTLDRLRLATEYFTNPAFQAAMSNKVWAISQGRA